MNASGRASKALAKAAAALALLVCALALCTCPGRAFAAVDVDGLKATAQVQTDGALHITEQRTCELQETRSALAVPVTSIQQDSKLSVSAIRFAHVTVQGGIDGNWTSLEEVAFSADMRAAYEQTGGIAARVAAHNSKADDGSGSGGAYLPEQPSFAVDPRDRVIYLFFPATSGRILFDIDYEVTNAVRAFDDVAELYWDYVAEDADARVSGVTVSVQLPMPEGMEAVPEQNVFAWGHGAAGTVDVRADGTVAFRVPEVLPGQYAQAHILFPVAWLTNLPLEARFAYSGTRLDAAKAEEEAWTDTWSAWLANSYAVDLAFVLLAVVIIGAASGLYLTFGRERGGDGGPSENERLEDGDLPTGFEAAIMGRLLRWNHASPLDMPASLMQLAARGALRIDALSNEGPFGRGYEELRIRQGKRAKDIVSTAADQELFRLLFDVWGEGYAAVTTTDIVRHSEKVGRERFRQELAGFTDALTKDVDGCGFFDQRSARVQRGIIIAGMVCFLLALIFGVAGGSLMRGTAMAVAGAACLVIGNYTGRLTSVGLRVQAAAQDLKASLEGSPLENISDEDAPYGLELGVAGTAPARSVSSAASSHQSRTSPEASEESLAVRWLAPRTGRGGAPIPSLAQAWASEMEKRG